MQKQEQLTWLSEGKKSLGMRSNNLTWKKNAKGNFGKKIIVSRLYNNNTRMDIIYVIAHLLYVCTTGEISDLDVTFTKIFFLILTMTVQLLPMGI